MIAAIRTNELARALVMPGGVWTLSVGDRRETDAVVASVFKETRTDETQTSRCLVIRGDRCLDEHAFFDEVSAVMQFPLYFGENWDAFHDVLFDNRVGGECHVLFLVDAGRLLERESNDKVRWLFQDLAELAGERSERKRGWRQTTVVLVDEKAGLDRLLGRLSATGEN